VRETAVTVRSLDPAPAMIAARVCGGVNASGVRSRMCLSTFPSRSAWAQQSTVPVIGFLSGQSPAEYASNLASFRRGLYETGYVEHRNVGI
jgi:hypothetical protein